MTTAAKPADLVPMIMSVGVALIVFQLAITVFLLVATASGLKPGTEVLAAGTADFWNTVTELGKKLPFAVLGFLLILIAAVLLGGLDANLVFTGVETSPSATPPATPTPIPTMVVTKTATVTAEVSAPATS